MKIIIIIIIIQYKA